MKKLLPLVFVLTACAPERAREIVDVPTYTAPCTIDASCADGVDVDPTHDHTDQWRALPCAEACTLLLKDKSGFDDVYACEPMRLDEGLWVVPCDYDYTPDDDGT